ncbi:hypothetical protein PBRA_006695 [Plasmodiophora brassicae]|uniref:PIN domain-containing protein n=1 Tax=Plasmodiophora brassicae TaxID=37360 RepID=A0A0G4ITW6_PLABS|nr:hypothetical protein PBRA_006695 [Plasmodiophora brassicae]
MSGWVSDDGADASDVAAHLRRARHAQRYPPMQVIGDDVDGMEIDGALQVTDVVQDAIQEEIRLLRVRPHDDHVDVGALPMAHPTDGADIAIRLVVDTNFLLGHLRWMSSIKPVLVAHNVAFLVPYVVMQELDALKGSERLQCGSMSTGSLARQAIRQLHQWMRVGDRAVHGQMLTQRLNASGAVLGNDDEVLACCLWFHLRQCRVVLLSNDMNLCVKAMANRVPTLSRTDGFDLGPDADQGALIDHLFNLTAMS